MTRKRSSLNYTHIEANMKQNKCTLTELRTYCSHMKQNKCTYTELHTYCSNMAQNKNTHLIKHILQPYDIIKIDTSNYTHII